MKTGILGGSFDPIHYGHLLLAETCMQECGLSRVLFVPTRTAPHKAGAHASAEDRIEMVNLAINTCEQFSASRFEVDSPDEVNYTVDTLRYFKESLLDSELYLILGADMFNDLVHWKEAEEVCRLATPIVACRPGASAPYFESLSQIVPQKRLEMFRRFLVQMPQIELSSTTIRERIAAGKSIRFLTPGSVVSYIIARGLYDGKPADIRFQGSGFRSLLTSNNYESPQEAYRSMSFREL